MPRVYHHAWEIKVGTTFGLRTVIEEPRRVQIRPRVKGWLCKVRCVCGAIDDVPPGKLVKGFVKCCRRCRNGVVGEKNSTHGMTETPLYRVYRGILRRCYNHRQESYQYYGAKGIRMCDAWRSGFEPFRDWALTNGYRKGLLIDRKDVCGDYCPENCRWVDAIASANNKSDSLFVEAFGERKTAAEWSRDDRCKVGSGTLYRRLREGWEPEAAIARAPLR